MPEEETFLFETIFVDSSLIETGKMWATDQFEMPLPRSTCLCSDNTTSHSLGPYCLPKQIEALDCSTKTAQDSIQTTSCGAGVRRKQFASDFNPKKKGEVWNEIGMKWRNEGTNKQMITNEQTNRQTVECMNEGRQGREGSCGHLHGSSMWPWLRMCERTEYCLASSYSHMFGLVFWSRRNFELLFDDFRLTSGISN